MWRAYYDLPYYGYYHRMVNHSINFVDPRTRVSTQRIENLWKNIVFST